MGAGRRARGHGRRVSRSGAPRVPARASCRFHAARLRGGSAMSDAGISDLLSNAAFSFVGTVEHLGAATMEDVPIGERTAVVRVDQVLHAPDAFAQLAGTSLTLQLRDDRDPLEVGASAVFFANGLAFGASLALEEVDRRPVEDLEPHVTHGVGAAAAPLETLQRGVEAVRLNEHAAGAAAIVLARVVGLERAS